MREGCEDYLYLWLLRERLSRLPVQRESSPAAAQARALLATAATKVVGTSGEQVPPKDQIRNTQSNRVPHKLRLEIADLIERLAE